MPRLLNRSFSKRYQIKILQWAKIRSSVYTNKNIQFTRLLVKLQSQDKWYIGIDVHVLFISLEEELKSTNQIRSILLGARDRRKKDEASQYRSVIESPFFSFLSLSLFFFSQSAVSYPQTVCLPGSLSCSLEHHSSTGRAIRLATFCIERTVSSASRIHLFAVSPLLADRELISFDVVIHLSRGTSLFETRCDCTIRIRVWIGEIEDVSSSNGWNVIFTLVWDCSRFI